MKKIFAMLLSIGLALSLTACGGYGHIENANILDIDSGLYSEAEIDAAVDITLEYFKNNFEGCTLLEIQYIGDASLDAFDEWAKQYNSAQAIILVSSFDVDSSGGDGSLNPNSKYDDWQWILTRNGTDGWTLQTWGY